ncbi:hypothetical protein REA38_11560 [Serratia sp. MF2]|uniref:hypothetical protein n=1 Tax=Serratia sp. MF1(2023) TaxID=3059171 RepID=UPI0027EDD564|nr:hypothetical protein [Serratia sp. MF1(2023)]MDQ7104186.1 hypothetical protein [Serratia sp. MF1(2023)]
MSEKLKLYDLIEGDIPGGLPSNGFVLLEVKDKCVISAEFFNQDTFWICSEEDFDSYKSIAALIEKVKSRRFTH